MDSPNLDNHSKASIFNTFKHFLYKYHFISEHLTHNLVFLHEFVPSVNQVLSIDKVLKNDNVSHLGMGNNPATSLYSYNTKSEHFFDKKENIKISKITKRSYAYKGYASTFNVDIINSFNP